MPGLGRAGAGRANLSRQERVDLREHSQPRTLLRALGLGQVVASGVGIIIGAGIYVLIGAATEQSGSTVWLAVLLAGGLSALTALSYAELAAMFPTAGAEYDYTRRVAPKGVAFVVGWVPPAVP